MFQSVTSCRTKRLSPRLRDRLLVRSAANRRVVIEIEIEIEIDDVYYLEAEGNSADRSCYSRMSVEVCRASYRTRIDSSF